VTLGAAVLVCTCLGCARSFYRKSADRDVYSSIAEKALALNPGELPQNASIDAGPESRFFDPFDADHPPLPPDDPISHELMKRVDGKRGASAGQKPGHPEAAGTDSWRQFLPKAESGEVVLDLKNAVRLGIRNSREYQAEREDLYLSALDVTFERFQFSPQLALGTRGTWDGRGQLRANAPRALQNVPVLTDGSVRWLAATGGELLAGFANSLVWNFDGDSVTRTAGSILNFSLVQPLLRYGGRARVLEDLTRAERKLLANVRQMQQFENGFYVHTASGRNSGEGPSRGGNVGAAGLGLIAGTPAGRTGAPRADGFLGLLEEQQRIRNLESNVARLRESLDQLEAAFDAGRISSRLQVDQARQALFNGQSSLLSARAAYDTRIDSYKMELGLPPGLPLVVKDALLDRFNSSDAAATTLDKRLAAIQSDLRNPDRIRNVGDLRRQLTALRALEQPLNRQLKTIQQDIVRLRESMPHRQAQLRLLGARPDLADLSIEPARVDPATLTARVKQLEQRIAHVGQELEQELAGLRAFDPEEPGVELEAARSKLSEIASDLSGMLLALSLDQTATRLETATLPPIDLSEEEALAIAKENRLDLMNARARLVDAWRQIDYNANPLNSTLDIVADGTMGTLRNNASRFDGRTGFLRMGLRFDTPLNRLAERNDYRESIVAYQRARRDYMLFEDRISQSIRNSLRIVKLSQFNFELRRSAVQIAIAQVDLARLRLEEPPKPGAPAQFGATTARDLVSALNDLLDSQNDFLSLQVGYDVVRMVLDFELGTMRIDHDGLWVDPGAITRANLAANASNWKVMARPPNPAHNPPLVLPKKTTNLTAR
jgi:uncharacterized protein YceH (UPF0502 family)